MNLCVKCTNFSDLETILLDIRMSEALGNGRAARIILDDGNYSDVIELSRCRPQGDSPSPRQLNMGGGGFFSFCSYSIQHCFICRPSDSTVPTNAGIEPRTVATCALAVRRSNH